VKTEELSAEQKERAATANLFVTPMIRLERDCGERAIMRVLAAQAKGQAGAVEKQS
jgi:hypothetical protein